MPGYTEKLSGRGALERHMTVVPVLNAPRNEVIDKTDQASGSRPQRGAGVLRFSQEMRKLGPITRRITSLADCLRRRMGAAVTDSR